MKTRKILVIVGIASLFVFGTFSLKSFKQEEPVSGKTFRLQATSNSKIMAVNVEQEDGSYQESTEIPRSAGGDII